MNKLVNFDVAIESLGDRYRVRVLSSPAGETQADFALPFSSKDLKILVLEVVGSIGRLRRNVRRIQSPERQMLEDFGGQLFQAVFSGPVRECLGLSRRAAEAQDAGLRIRLRLPPALVNIPWEYLYDADYGGFVSLSPETALVRYMEMPTPVPPLPVRPPLRILSMISAPADVPELQGDDEWGKLTGSLADLIGRGLVEVDRLESGTLAALQRPLRLRDYHVLHFVGHGGFNEDAQDGALALEGADGLTRLVTGRDLGMMIRGHRSLRLVVLNACEGARSAQDDPFGGVAQALVRQGIPAVIAMQFEISDPAALTFSQSFYEAIADGLPVDAAVVEARRAMFAEGNEVEWATPVLYLRAPDGRVFTRDGDPDAGAGADDAGHAGEQAGAGASAGAGRQTDEDDARRAREEAERQARDLATRYMLACAAADAGDWEQALVALTMIADVNPGYRDVGGRLEHARRQQRIASLQAQVRRLHGAGQWADAVAAGDRLHALDPAAADPEGLVAAARAELAATEQAGRMDADYEAALRFLDSGNWYQAVGRLERVAQVNPAYRATPALLERARRKLAESVPRTAARPSAQRQQAPKQPASGAAAQVERGDSLFGRHRYADAVAAYRAALKLDGRLAAAHAGLGRVLARRREWAEAEAACREAIRLDPNLAVAHARLGVALVGARRPAEAEAACREAIRLAPALAEARLDLGAVLAALRRYAEAEVACREAVRLDPSLADARFGLGMTLGALRRFAEAEVASREAVRLDPASGLARASVAFALLGLDRFAEADAECREAIRLEPDLPEPHVVLALALAAGGRLAEAEAACREAMRIDPENSEARYFLGLLLRGSGRLAEAEGMFRDAIRFGLANAEAHEGLGMLLTETDRLAEAEASYREAIRIDPGMASAHNHLGVVFSNAKRFGEAEAEFREAIRLDPGLAIAHANLGVALTESRRLTEAEAAYRQAIRLDPAVADTHNRLGVVLTRSKRYPEAEAAYREAIRLDPGLAVAHNNLGDVLARMKRYKEAEAACKEAARIDPAFRTQAGMAKVARWLSIDGR